MIRRTAQAAILGALVAPLVLAGCGSTGAGAASSLSTAGSASSPAAASSSTAPSGAAGSSTSSAPASSTSSATHSASADPSSSRAGTSSQAAPSTPAAGAGVGRCVASHLKGSVAPGAGGAAGSVGIDLKLTNTGTSTCRLQGWPGVSMVYGGNGTQLGAPARQDHVNHPHPTVTLRPGHAAYVPLRITQAANYPAKRCGQRIQADGFRVYPPGSKQAIFIRDAHVTGCTSTAVILMTVAAVQPSAS